MTDIELSSAAANTAIKKVKVDIEPLWTHNRSQHLGAHICPICNENSAGQVYRVPEKGNVYVCQDCWDENQQAGGKPEGDYVGQMVKALISSTKSTRSSKASAAKRKQNTVSAKAQPYIEMGLGGPFAEAIARDLSLADSVMDLWEADWWKQYEVDDILIVAVLEGVIQEEDGKWLNTIRSDHEDLVVSCIEKHCTVDWARALMECGLETHSQAVTSILQGGEPELVARIAKIQINKDLVPPACKPFVRPNSESDETVDPSPLPLAEVLLIPGSHRGGEE
jgi:predicted RNA-binding Zn-ribbon protein involved in translation (DUF1610 family)